MGFTDFRDFSVWHKSIMLAKEVHRLSKKLPQNELFGLQSQMSRAATSVASNIAEGQSRGSAKDFIRFLYISNGSVAEIQTQLILCVEYGYLMQEDIDVAMDLAIQTAKMLNSLIKTIKIRNGMK